MSSRGKFIAASVFLPLLISFSGLSKADEAVQTQVPKVSGSQILAKVQKAEKTGQGSEINLNPSGSVALSRQVMEYPFSVNTQTTHAITIKSYSPLVGGYKRVRDDVEEVVSAAKMECSESSGTLEFARGSIRAEDANARQIINSADAGRLFGTHSCIAEGGEVLFRMYVENSPALEATFMPPGLAWELYFKVLDRSHIQEFDRLARDFANDVETLRSTLKTGTKVAVRAEGGGGYECGLIIDVKDPLAQVQNRAGLRYVDKNALFPTVSRSPSAFVAVNYKCKP